jgi:hypothetical protein
MKDLIDSYMEKCSPVMEVLWPCKTTGQILKDLIVYGKLNCLSSAVIFIVELSLLGL